MGDFYVDKNDENDASLKDVCQFCYLKHLINVPTCYKNPDNPSVIDLMLTNSHCNFQNSWVVETGLSDFIKYWLLFESLKMEPKTVSYQNYKNYPNEIFWQLTFDEFAKIQIQVCNEMLSLQTY